MTCLRKGKNWNKSQRVTVIEEEGKKKICLAFTHTHCTIKKKEKGYIFDRQGDDNPNIK